MSIFRVILAILFSLVIVGGIWNYYTNHDVTIVKDPFSQLLTYIRDVTSDELPSDTPVHPEDDTDVSSPSDDSENPLYTHIHQDFSFGTLRPDQLERIQSSTMSIGPEGATLFWLHYCDFEASYCQKSVEKGVVYDYLEAYPHDLAYAYKSFPPTMLEQDILPHRALLCAQDKGTSDQFLDYYYALYAQPHKHDIDGLIDIGRSLGIEGIATCLDENTYDLLIQQDIKFIKHTFAISALPANIFINLQTGRRVLVPGYYPSDEVLAGVALIE